MTSTPGQKNESRKAFVSLEVAAQSFGCMPRRRMAINLRSCRDTAACDAHQSTLRCFWEDIDWERRRFLVRATKMEHHEDGGERWVRSSRVAPYLEDCREL